MLDTIIQSRPSTAPPFEVFDETYVSYRRRGGENTYLVGGIWLQSLYFILFLCTENLAHY